MTAAQERPEYRKFAIALRDAMAAKGLTASEVARRIWGQTKDRRGYQVARNRDRIGNYLAATSYPKAEILQKLADALEIPVTALRSDAAPTRRAARDLTGAAMPLPADAEGVHVTLFGDGLARARLVFNRKMDAALAMDIIDLLRKAAP